LSAIGGITLNGRLASSISRKGYTPASWLQQGIAELSEMLQQLIDKNFTPRLIPHQLPPLG
jgi:hypothetical protein